MSTETIIGILALGLTVLGGGWALLRRAIRAAGWRGEVNADRVSFKEFMQEIRDKIDKIFDRLPPVVGGTGPPSSWDPTSGQAAEVGFARPAVIPGPGSPPSELETPAD